MKGLKTNGIKELKLSDDGSRARIILEQHGEPFYVEVPIDDLEALIPLITKAVAVSRDPKVVTAITLSAVRVDLDRAGEVLLCLTNTAGAEMTFALDRPQVVELSALIDEAQQNQSGSSQKH